MRDFYQIYTWLVVICFSMKIVQIKISINRISDSGDKTQWVKKGEVYSLHLQGKLEAWRRWNPCRGRPRPPLWSALAGRHGNRWDTSLRELRDKPVREIKHLPEEIQTQESRSNKSGIHTETEAEVFQSAASRPLFITETHSRKPKTKKTVTFLTMIKKKHSNGYFSITRPVWKRDLSTSGGMATAQLNIPAIPPANNTLGTLSSLWLWGRINRLRAAFHTEPTAVNSGDTIYLFPGGVSRFFSHS